MLLTRRANTTGSLLQGMGVGSASCQERLCKTEFSAPKLRRTISFALVDLETSMRPREHDLLVSFATIFCQYTRGAAPVNFSSELARVMQVFSEESNAPLNDWPRDLRPATVFHAAACFVRALDVDPECIVFALVLLERLGIELLQVLLAPSTWRNVLISTLALATKVWYDESVHLHDVHERLLPYGYNTGDLPRQELLLVKLVQYDVAFSSSTYFSYMYPMLSIRPSSEAMRIFEEISVLLEDTTSTEDCKSTGEALAWHC